MTEDSTLRSVIKETTDLLKQMSLEQSRQIAELRDSIADIRNIERRLQDFESWRSGVNKTLNGLCKQQAVDEYSRQIADRDESRAYSERRALWEQILEIGSKLAGIAALIAILVDKFI